MLKFARLARRLSSVSTQPTTESVVGRELTDLDLESVTGGKSRGGGGGSAARPVARSGGGGGSCPNCD